MSDNLRELIASKQLEVEGLELLRQANTLRTTNSQDGGSSLSEKDAAGPYRGPSETDIQALRAAWHQLLDDPAVVAHVSKTEPAPLPPNTPVSVKTTLLRQIRPEDAPEYLKVLTAHFVTLRPLFVKFIRDIELGINGLVDNTQQKTSILADTERFARDIFEGMGPVLRSQETLTLNDMGRLSFLRKTGAVDGLLGIAESLLEASQETNPQKKLKLLTEGGKLGAFLSQAVESESKFTRVFAKEQYQELIALLDKTAGELQAAGHEDLALELDKVTNTLDPQG